MSKKNGDFSYRDSVTFKEHFNVQLKDLEEEIDVKFAARDKALELQADLLKSRLENLNEWRTQNKDEREQFLTRSEYEVKHQLLIDKMDAMQKIIWLALGSLVAIDYIIKFIK
jgi:hypothetical protein